MTPRVVSHALDSATPADPGCAGDDFVLDLRYLLVINIPCYVDDAGIHRVDPLWHKDILGHMACIRDLRLAAPARSGPAEHPLVDVPPEAGVGVLHHVDLPPCRSTLAALATLPRAAVALWKAIGRADVVHANVGGWPISYGWLAVPMARLRGKFVLTNVEAAGWRVAFREPSRPKEFVRAVIYEGMARLCVNLSLLMTCTHSGYRDSMLLKGRHGRGHVFSATWIDAGDILPQEEAEALWAAKIGDAKRPLRVVFAATLTKLKGVGVLLRALAELDRRGVPMDVAIYGAGEMSQACDEAAARMSGGVRLTLGGRLDLGAPFSEMLMTQDVLVSPNLSDEQPRVVFDAYAKALPVIASDTPGLRQCVSDGETGRLVPRDDAEALADALARASDDRATLRTWGLNGMSWSRTMTHDQMHARRAALIGAEFRRTLRRRQGADVRDES